MIHWGWLIVAFFGGMFTGVLVLALCWAAGRDDREEAALRGELAEWTNDDPPSEWSSGVAVAFIMEHEGKPAGDY